MTDQGEGGAAASFDVFAESDAATTVTFDQDGNASEGAPKIVTQKEGEGKADENPYGFLGDDEETPAGDGEKETIEGGDQGQGNDSAADIRSVVAAQLAKQLGRVVEVPEDLNEDNLAEKLMEMGRSTLHPEVVRLQKAIEAGVDPKSYYESYSQFDQALGLPDRELVKRSLQANYGKSDDRPDGWDDAKIETRVGRMNEDDLEDRAEAIRNSIRQQKAARDQELSQVAQTKMPDPSTEEFKQTFETGFKQVFDDVMKDGELYGLRFSSPEKQKAAAARLKEVLYPDTKTRQNKFVSALQNPKEAMKIAMLWDMAQTGALKLSIEKQNAATKKSLGDFLAKRPSSSAAPRAKDQPTDFSHFSSF